MSTFKREPRYLVFKIKDLNPQPNEAPATQRIREWLGRAVNADARHYSELRTNIMGKPELECLVIEKDWPEYELAWHLIEARMSGNPGHLVDAQEFAELISMAAEVIDTVTGSVPVTDEYKRNAKAAVAKLYDLAENLQAPAKNQNAVEISA
ncbi:hypothetical protein PHACT_12760 [Pseudohongiella acticola]|uniref:Uncharacterized protein n=1 Tax=Pseudohongiella acticola TaxID=1524254 RepID=A0A1E8CG29_9GAMM|nr:hypothetical protein [Pseudohongiella acticola]OFE11421.1 hypothetical protein PHACT_12760 [Pseudohongiella acticola]